MKVYKNMTVFDLINNCEKLEKENAELRERMSKASELIVERDKVQQATIDSYKAALDEVMSMQFAKGFIWGMFFTCGLILTVMLVILKTT